MHELIRSNKRRSALVIVVFCAVFVAIGWIVGLTVGGGWTLTVIALVLSLVLSVGSWWSSAAIALKVSRARPADETEYRRLHNLVEAFVSQVGYRNLVSTSLMTKRQMRSLPDGILNMRQLR